MNLTVIYYNIVYKSKKPRTNEKYKNTAEIKKMWGKVEQCGGKCVSLNPNSFINKNACDF